MIFVDTNVFMYAVGREHPLRQDAQDFSFNPGNPRNHSSVLLKWLKNFSMHIYLQAA